MRARRAGRAGFALALLLAGCGGAGPAFLNRAPAAQVTPAPTGAANVQVEVVVTGLDTPWAIAFAPDERIFVTERPGRIRIIQNGQLQPDPWLTLDVAQTPGNESGLLGLALDPQFARNHLVYVAYTYRTESGSLANRLVRLREDPATGKGAVDKTLLDGALGAADHDGGRVKFGPDGKLYWTMGDAENQQLAQDTTSLNGKILRLNADGTMPADNPFPNSPVYAYGLRNPQGLAWQPGSGRLYATEHGPSGATFCCRDEINLIEAGKNYGWPVVAGDVAQDGYTPPVISSGASITWAPSGATFATQGPWAGSMLIAGLRGQALYRLTLAPNDPMRAQALEQYLQGQYGRLRDVEEGPDGRLYVLTSNRDGRGSPVPEDDRVLRLTVGP